MHIEKHSNVNRRAVAVLIVTVIGIGGMGFLKLYAVSYIAHQKRRENGYQFYWNGCVFRQCRQLPKIIIPFTSSSLTRQRRRWHGLYKKTNKATAVSYFLGCTQCTQGTLVINSSSSGQNGRHFTDDNFMCIFMNEFSCILIQITVKFDFEGWLTIKQHWSVNGLALNRRQVITWTQFTDAYIRR